MKRTGIRKTRAEAAQLTDPVATAKAAGLHYVSDARPGIRRKRAGKSFIYIDVDGKRLRDPIQLNRIKSLAIPPAWTVVWICPLPYGHIQATGRDARRRKQYRYHSKWRKLRDETKYSRMLVFGEALPMIRQRVAEDMAKPDLSREIYLQVWNELSGTDELVAFDERGEVRTLYPTDRDVFFAGPGAALPVLMESR